MFKEVNEWDPLHDETVKISLPVDEKGVLILDFVTRYRIMDTITENDILCDYMA